MKPDKNLKHYFIFTYLLFWASLALCGLFISLGIPEIYQNIIKNLCAWTPTLVLLLMFKKLYPNTKLLDFLNSNLRAKLKAKHFMMALLLQAGVFGFSILAYTTIHDINIKSLSFIHLSAFIPTLLWCASSGAMGEELGWRAYALNALQKRHAPLLSSIIIGLIWGFWHLPLMLMSGYTGLNLAIYCFCFLLAILSLSIIISYFYNKSGNILIAMWIHFLFNLFLQIVLIDLLTLLLYMTTGYLIIAILLFAIAKSEFIRKPIIIK